MAYIKTDETKRITAASYTHHCGDEEIEVEIPDEVWGNGIHNYLYVDGLFVYDPLPEPEQPDNPSGDDSSVWDELDAAYQAGYNEGYTEGVNGAYDQ